MQDSVHTDFSGGHAAGVHGYDAASRPAIADRILVAFSESSVTGRTGFVRFRIDVTAETMEPLTDSACRGDAPAVDAPVAGPTAGPDAASREDVLAVLAGCRPHFMASVPGTQNVVVAMLPAPHRALCLEAVDLKTGTRTPILFETDVRYISLTVFALDGGGRRLMMYAMCPINFESMFCAVPLPAALFAPPACHPACLCARHRSHLPH